MPENLNSLYEKVLNRKDLDSLKDLRFDLATTLPEDITLAAVKRNFRQEMRRFHPDVSKEENAEAQTKLVNAAYEHLTDHIDRIVAKLQPFYTVKNDNLADSAKPVTVTRSETMAPRMPQYELALESVVDLLNNPSRLAPHLRYTLIDQYHQFFGGVLEAHLNIHRYQYRQHGNEKQLFGNLVRELSLPDLNLNDQELNYLKMSYDGALTQVLKYFEYVFTKEELKLVFKAKPEAEGRYFLDLQTTKSLLQKKITNPLHYYSVLASLRTIRNLSLSFPVSRGVNTFGLLSGSALVDELGLTQVLDSLS